MLPTAAHAGLLVASAPSCESSNISKPFLPWRDNADYVLNQGASFEIGADGWSLNGATVVPGNEPWHVTSAADASSLRIAPGNSAVSAIQCVGLEHPTLRFFAKRSGGGLLGGVSTLTVSVLAETSLGLVVPVPIGLVTNNGTWQPTPPILVVANLLPLLPGNYTPVAFAFTPVGSATWQIDDLYVDPHSRG
jgi:hypothetical protein